MFAPNFAGVAWCERDYNVLKAHENIPFSNKKWASNSPFFVENAPFSNKELASISPFFVENALFSNKELASISAVSKIAFPISKTIINRVTSRVTL